MPAGDFYGKRTLLVLGLCFFILGAFLAFFAPTLPVLIASGLVQGAGAAIMMAMPLAMVRDLMPPSQIGRWMGFLGTMTAIGTASGPAIGGALAAGFGWRTVYLLQVPVALVAFVFCLIWIQKDKGKDEKGAIDLLGASALAVFLIPLTFLVPEMANGFDLADGLLTFVASGALVAFS